MISFLTVLVNEDLNVDRHWCLVPPYNSVLSVEKVVFNSTIGLLFDIQSKTKAGLYAHKDLQALEITAELHPQERQNGKAYLPLASHTHTTEEKRAICKCLCSIRAPT
jgi:hypothetical protein